MELGLRGKRVWVLGASSGLGLAIASANKIGAHAIPLDVSAGRQSIEEACESAAEALSGLDIVIVNHGGPPPGGFDAVDDATFGKAYEVVLASTFRVTKAAVPHLRRAGGGVLLYVTSSTTKEVPS